MLLFTLANQVTLTSATYVAPFVVATTYNYTIASWWTGWTGDSGGEVPTGKRRILSVTEGGTEYANATDMEDCFGLEHSWFASETTLYVHLDHNVSLWGMDAIYGDSVGFSDFGVVYVDDILHLPLLASSPSPGAAVDIGEYKKIRLNSGSVELQNLDGRLEWMKDVALIGNKAILSTIDDDLIIDGQADLTDVTDLESYFVSSAEYGSDAVRLELKDPRDVSTIVPSRVFTSDDYTDLSDSIEGQVVPLVYGICREVRCYPVNTDQTGTLSVTYRCAEVLTAISSVRIKIGDTWTIATVASSDLPNGSFTIASARPGTGQAPYECKANVTGITVVNAPDIIVDLYLRAQGQPFTDTFYKTAEWTANKAGVPTCGLVIDKETELLDVIPKIQNGVYPSFLFSSSLGKKTLRIIDENRAVDWFVSAVEILNIDKLRLVENVDTLFGSVTVSYNRAHYSDTTVRTTDDSHAVTVERQYQRRDSVLIDSLLTPLPLASAMASAKAEEFSTPTKTMELVLMGQRFYPMALYDIVQFDTAMGRDEYHTGDFTGREFLGVKVGKVVSVVPDFGQLTVTAVVKVLDRVPDAV